MSQQCARVDGKIRIRKRESESEGEREREQSGRMYYAHTYARL